jgi:hypothetical protein
MGSLALTYFRIRMHTIIGAAPFHCPVRDGKEWDQSAMGTRLNLLPMCCQVQHTSQSGRSKK